MVIAGDIDSKPENLEDVHKEWRVMVREEGEREITLLELREMRAAGGDGGLKGGAITLHWTARNIPA